jgi:DNA-binding MarR family transcriptional regulator
MGYWETLELLQKQLKEINDKQEYLIKQRHLALQTKDIAKELDLNIKNVSISIRKLLKTGEIEQIKGLINKTEKFYILSLKHLEEKIWKQNK